MVEPGKRLGPYVIDSRIGAGGMGEVWKARDTRLDRSVAIKILPAEFAQNVQLKLRFEREAKTISQLNHPHICTLYDVGDDYLVMELLEGDSLADRLERGPLPLPDVIKFGSQIADALDKAHRQGVIHRDLKPGNIMLTKSGAKLLDFGLAKSAMSAVSIDGATEHKPLTQEGTILGTFQYMAPEQLEGMEADARTDLFALGAVLYEMATGKRAFEGKTKTSLIAAIVKEQPRPISEMQPLTPPALEHVIAKCLSKDPEDRWQSAHDVAEELRWIGEAGSQVGVAAPFGSHRRTRARLLWSAAILAAMLAGAAATRVWLGQRPQRAMSLVIPAYDTNYSGGALAKVSPDGSMFCFIARTSEDKPRLLFVRELASQTARGLEGTEGVYRFYTWSGDSRKILFVASNKLKAVDVRSGAIEAIGDAPETANVAMNKDGVLLLGSARGPISRLDPKSGAIAAITKLDKSRHEAFHYAPIFLPDQKRFLFIAFSRDPNKREQRVALYGASLDSPEVKRIGEIPSIVAYVQPGYLLFVREGTLMAVKFDARTLVMSGDPAPIADGVFYFKPNGFADFSASDNGVVVYRSPVAGAPLAWLDQHGTRVGSVAREAVFDQFRIAPDEQSVIATVTDPKVGTADIWSFGFRRGTATRLTSEENWEGAPVLTPDGNTMFYSSDRLGVPDIFVKQLGSAEDDRPLIVAPGEQYAEDVSRDGKYLLFTTDDYAGTNSDIHVMPLDGSGKSTRFVRTNASETAPRFSPDGKWVAYHSGESGSSQIYVKPFPGPGQARQISTAGGQFPRWSRDGKRVYFRYFKKIFVADMTAADQDPRLLFEVGQTLGNVEVGADDRLLADMLDDLAATRPTRVIVNWPALLKK